MIEKSAKVHPFFHAPLPFDPSVINVVRPYWRPTDRVEIQILGPRLAFGVVLRRGESVVLAAFFERN